MTSSGNDPFYVVVSATTAGEQDVLGELGRRRRRGRQVLARRVHEDQERCIKVTCVAVCDWLKVVPKSISATLEHAITRRASLIWMSNNVQVRVAAVLRYPSRLASPLVHDYSEHFVIGSKWGPR